MRTKARQIYAMHKGFPSAFTVKTLCKVCYAKKDFYLSILTCFFLVFFNSFGAYSNGASYILLTGSVDETPDTPVEIAMSKNVSDNSNSGDCTWKSKNVTTITLNGDSISVNGTGVTVDGTTATITAGGYYLISGTLNDG